MDSNNESNMTSYTDEEMAEEINELREGLKTYRPGRKSEGVYCREKVQFPKHLCIGLFGKTGIGKTSLINSLKFAVSGSLKEGERFPVAPIEKGGAHTLKRVLAPLTNNICVIDNRGFPDVSEDGLFLKELKAQMDGKRGYSEVVKWGNTPNATDEDYIIDVDNGQDSIGCAVFVFSARDNIIQNIGGLHAVVDLLQDQQGRYPVAVVTNIDCPEGRQCVEALTLILHEAGITEIFEVANITDKKKHLETCYQHNLLSLLVRCMTDGDEAAVYRHYQQKEQTEKRGRIKTKELKGGQEKKVYLARSAGIMGSTTATGAVVGFALGGPVGSAVGAGVGGALGGSSFMFK